MPSWPATLVTTPSRLPRSAVVVSEDHPDGSFPELGWMAPLKGAAGAAVFCHDSMILQAQTRVSIEVSTVRSERDRPPALLPRRPGPPFAQAQRLLDGRPGRTMPSNGNRTAGATTAASNASPTAPVVVGKLEEHADPHLRHAISNKRGRGVGARRGDADIPRSDR